MMPSHETNDGEDFGFYVKGQADGPKHFERKPSRSTSGAVVCGVLSKYVNRFKGWRARLFVLDNCYLKYYKVYGPSGVHLPTLASQLRLQGEVKLIGAETHLLEAGRVPSWSSTNDVAWSVQPSSAIPSALASMELEDVHCAPEESSGCKFRIQVGRHTLQCRAETREDQQAWLQAIASAQAALGMSNGDTMESSCSSPSPSMSMGSTSQPEDLRIMGATSQPEDLHTRLLSCLASAAVPSSVVGEVLALWDQQEKQAELLLQQEQTLRKELEAMVGTLQDEKRELETQLVVLCSPGSRQKQQRRSYGRQEAAVMRSGSQLLSESDLSGDRLLLPVQPSRTPPFLAAAKTASVAAAAAAGPAAAGHQGASGPPVTQPPAHLARPQPGAYNTRAALSAAADQLRSAFDQPGASAAALHSRWVTAREDAGPSAAEELSGAALSAENSSERPPSQVSASDAPVTTNAAVVEAGGGPLPEVGLGHFPAAGVRAERLATAGIGVESLSAVPTPRRSAAARLASASSWLGGSASNAEAVAVESTGAHEIEETGSAAAGSRRLDPTAALGVAAGASRAAAPGAAPSVQLGAAAAAVIVVADIDAAAVAEEEESTTTGRNDKTTTFLCKLGRRESIEGFALSPEGKSGGAEATRTAAAATTATASQPPAVLSSQPCLVQSPVRTSRGYGRWDSAKGFRWLTRSFSGGRREKREAGGVGGEEKDTEGLEARSCERLDVEEGALQGEGREMLGLAFGQVEAAGSASTAGLFGLAAAGPLGAAIAGALGAAGAGQADAACRCLDQGIIEQQEQVGLGPGALKEGLLEEGFKSRVGGAGTIAKVRRGEDGVMAGDAQMEGDVEEWFAAGSSRGSSNLAEYLSTCESFPEQQQQRQGADRGSRESERGEQLSDILVLSREGWEGHQYQQQQHRQQRQGRWSHEGSRVVATGQQQQEYSKRQQQADALLHEGGTKEGNQQHQEEQEELQQQPGVALGNHQQKKAKRLSQEQLPSQRQEQQQVDQQQLQLSPGLKGHLDVGAQAVTAWLQHQPLLPRRQQLPPPLQAPRPVKLWSLIKQAIGQDLTRLCLPAYFNEPLGALQRAAEELLASHLLDMAAQHACGSVQRLLCVGLYGVAGYSCTAGRTFKPFNPLLGETYEMVCPERGWRFLAEKVVHHPTVLSVHAQGRGWVLEGDADMKSRFWGRSIEVMPVGVMQVTFEDGEVISFNKVTSFINNVILGQIHIEHDGVMRVTQEGGSLSAAISFKEPGIFERRISSSSSGHAARHPVHGVKGWVEGKQGRLAGAAITGTWTGKVSAYVDGEEVASWHPPAPPSQRERYNLSAFALQLNELQPQLTGILAPTDSRLRPDLRALECGDFDAADVQKQRLEQRQRAARRAADAGQVHDPRWFRAQPGAVPGQELVYKYKGGYWEARDAGQLPTCCPDIFGGSYTPPT